MESGCMGFGDGLMSESEVYRRTYEVVRHLYASACAEQTHRVIGFEGQDLRR